MKCMIVSGVCRVLNFIFTMPSYFLMCRIHMRISLWILSGYWFSVQLLLSVITTETHTHTRTECFRSEYLWLMCFDSLMVLTALFTWNNTLREDESSSDPTSFSHFVFLLATNIDSSCTLESIKRFSSQSLWCYNRLLCRRDNRRFHVIDLFSVLCNWSANSLEGTSQLCRLWPNSCRVRDQWTARWAAPADCRACCT